MAEARRRRRKLCARSAALVQLAGMTGGTATAEAACALGLRASIVASSLSMLVKAGHLFRGRRPGLCPRYFSAAQAAQAYVAAPAPVLAPSRGRKAPQPLVSGDAVSPPGHAPRVTVVDGPRHDARFQLPPEERPFGAGFAAIGLGRDVTTGRPWGAMGNAVRRAEANDRQ